MKNSCFYEGISRGMEGELFKILPDSIRYRIWQDLVRLLVQLLINESPQCFRLSCPENTVPGIAKSRTDVGMFV